MTFATGGVPHAGSQHLPPFFLKQPDAAQLRASECSAKESFELASSGCLILSGSRERTTVMLTPSSWTTTWQALPVSGLAADSAGLCVCRYETELGMRQLVEADNVTATGSR